MTAALYRLDARGLADVGVGSEVELTGAEGHHAVTVKRTGLGEPILLADGGPLVAKAVVIRLGKGRLTARIEHVDEAGHPGPRFVLVQALAKSDRDLQAVESATELGVDEVLPWQAERSIVRWTGDRGERAHRKWVDQAWAAAKQSRRPWAPVVSAPARTPGVVARARDAALILVLHEEAEHPLAEVELPTTGDVLLVIGPEGGIAPREIEELVAAGGRPVRMGRYVLRSSSAGPAALAVLSAAQRWR